MAIDADTGDLLLYSLEGDDADAFDVVERGTGEGEGTVSVARRRRSWTSSPIRSTYSFIVKATDPSGASDSVMVTVTLKGVDEDPELRLRASRTPKKWTTPRTAPSRCRCRDLRGG